MVAITTQTSGQTVESAHFRDLDGLRGLLALAVVLLHIGFNSFAMRAFGWKGFQFELSVDVFFLLSGFVLTHAAQRNLTLGTFVVRRFMRLAPVFYATTLILALVTQQRVSPLEIAIAVPFVGQDPANFPAWSITWELYLPILAVLAWTIRLRISRPMVLPLLVIALLALGYFDFGVALNERNDAIRALLGLLAGHLLYRAELSLPLRLEWAFAALLALMALARYFPIAAAAAPMVAAICIIAGQTGGSILGSAPLQLLGTLSYTLYLAHIPVLRAAQALLGEQVNANPLAKLTVLFGSFALAWLLTIVVERPAMALGAKLASNQRSSVELIPK